MAEGRPRGFSVATKCVTVDELIEKFRDRVDEESILVNPVEHRDVGTECAFAILLADRKPALAGTCVVLAVYTDANNPFKRPGMRLGIKRLGPESQRVFSELLAKRIAPRKLTQALPVITLPRSSTADLAPMKPVIVMPRGTVNTETRAKNKTSSDVVAPRTTTASRVPAVARTTTTPLGSRSGVPDAMRPVTTQPIRGLRADAPVAEVAREAPRRMPTVQIPPVAPAEEPLSRPPRATPFDLENVARLEDLAAGARDSTARSQLVSVDATPISVEAKLVTFETKPIAVEAQSRGGVVPVEDDRTEPNAVEVKLVVAVETKPIGTEAKPQARSAAKPLPATAFLAGGAKPAVREQEKPQPASVEPMPIAVVHAESERVEAKPERAPRRRETRTPGSPFVLPANPLTNLTDASLEGFVDCRLFENHGAGKPDAFPAGTIDELATVAPAPAPTRNARNSEPLPLPLPPPPSRAPAPAPRPARAEPLPYAATKLPDLGSGRVGDDNYHYPTVPRRLRKRLLLAFALLPLVGAGAVVLFMRLAVAPTASAPELAPATTIEPALVEQVRVAVEQPPAAPVVPEAPAPAVPVKPQRLHAVLVRTYPIAAKVTVGGLYFGTTPTYIKIPANTPVEVKMVRPGFKPVSYPFTSKRPTDRVFVRLQRARGRR